MPGCWTPAVCCVAVCSDVVLLRVALRRAEWCIDVVWLCGVISGCPLGTTNLRFLTSCTLYHTHVQHSRSVQQSSRRPHVLHPEHNTKTHQLTFRSFELETSLLRNRNDGDIAVISMALDHARFARFAPRRCGSDLPHWCSACSLTQHLSSLNSLNVYIIVQDSSPP